MENICKLMTSIAPPGLLPIACRDRGQRRCAARPRLISLRPSGTPGFETVSAGRPYRML